MSKVGSSKWYLDEHCMEAFICDGGNRSEKRAQFERWIAEYTSAHPIIKNGKIGYITVGAPLGAERLRWMFCTPEFSYMPVMLPKLGVVRIIESGDREVVATLEHLSSAEFLRSALNHIFIIEC